MNGEESVEGPRLVVDLDAIAANWRTVRQAFRGQHLGAVVKHDAYGLGAATVAPWLERQGCRDFWVDTFEEGIALRSCLHDAQTQVYVLHGLAGRPPAEYSETRLIPILSSMSEWAACRAVASATGAAPLKVGVQFDTGLTRLGIPAADAQTLGRNSLAGLEVVMWVAQLSRFDQADAAECLAERACFERLTADLPKAGRSLAASACVFADAVWHLEHARVGSALYGVATGPGLQGRLEPTVELCARVLRVMDVPAGTGVGYGGEWVAREPSTLATLAIGYGHGLPATFGEGGAVVAAGRLAPLVGGVAMGLCTADVSFMAPGALRVGDWVEIYGRQRPVHEAALAARLTPNALMTPTAKLARRVYKGCGLVEAGQ